MENKLNIKEYLDKDEQKDLLRLLTAGSVDDGKSTLIGRLLFDSKKLYEDQLAALERDSKRVGNAGDHIDYALLCDGLKAEREQGITIDVAYRYFSTNNRKFIIADTPEASPLISLICVTYTASPLTSCCPNTPVFQQIPAVPPPIIRIPKRIRILFFII